MYIKGQNKRGCNQGSNVQDNAKPYTAHSNHVLQLNLKNLNTALTHEHFSFLFKYFCFTSPNKNNVRPFSHVRHTWYTPSSACRKQPWPNLQNNFCFLAQFFLFVSLHTTCFLAHKIQKERVYARVLLHVCMCVNVQIYVCWAL